MHICLINFVKGDGDADHFLTRLIKSSLVRIFIMLSFSAHSPPLLVNQRSISDLIWATLIAASRRSLLRWPYAPVPWTPFSRFSLWIPPPLKLFPFSIWFPEGVRNQIELAPSYHSNCDSEFVVTEKTYWCIKHVSRWKILTQRSSANLFHFACYFFHTN